MGTIGQHQVSLFTSPVQGGNPVMLPNFVRGNDNTTAQQFNAHDDDASIHVVGTSTGSIGASAVAIASAVTNNAAFLVGGDNGSGKVFVDLVGMNGTVGAATQTKLYEGGTPDTRTYTVASKVLKVTMGGGTYSVTTIPFVFTS
jgi:hypothetical protein